jgi:hypothetical protein
MNHVYAIAFLITMAVCIDIVILVLVDRIRGDR